MNSIIFLEGFCCCCLIVGWLVVLFFICLIMPCFNIIFLTLQVFFLHIMDSDFVFVGDSCVCQYVSISMYVFFLLYLWLFVFLFVFCLFIFVCFYFILFFNFSFILDVCLFSFGTEHKQRHEFG